MLYAGPPSLSKVPWKACNSNLSISLQQETLPEFFVLGFKCVLIPLIVGLSGDWGRGTNYWAPLGAIGDPIGLIWNVGSFATGLGGTGVMLVLGALFKRLIHGLYVQL